MLMRCCSLVHMIGFTGFAIGLIPAASAQTRTADAARGAASLPDDTGVQDIVVTAQKREERLQDVPISVAVVDQKLLVSYGLRDVADIRQYVPNLQYEEGTEGASITLRGFGNNGGTNFGFDSPVGTFVDGVYHGRLNQTRLPFFDVERVEVLRGPQSTLFGMNTVAGALSVISRAPTRKLQGYATVEYDPTFRGVRGYGAVSGPITSTLSARFAFDGSTQDGYYYNSLLDRRYGGSDQYGGRAYFRWTPIDALVVDAKFDIARRKQDGINQRALSPPSDAATLTQMLAVDPDAVFSPSSRNVSQTPSFNINLGKEAVLTARYDFARVSLTSVTAYSLFDERSTLGQLAYSPVRVAETRGNERFRQFSQELRAASTGSNTVDYQIGVFYQRSTLANARPLDFYLANYLPVFAGSSSGSKQTYLSTFNQTYTTISTFLQATWHVTDTLKLIGGARYGKERKDARSYFDWLRPGGNSPADALTPGTPAFADADFVFHDLFRIERHRDSGRYRDTSFLPETKLQWQPSRNLNVYVSYSEGKKAGGFNDRDNRAVNFAFGPERSTNYEGGVKGQLFRGTADLNVAAFRTEFNDTQISVFDLTNLVFIVDNAAKALSQGIEVDGRARLTNALSVDFALGWLQKAKFKTFFVQCVPGPTDPRCLATANGLGLRDDGGKPLNTPKLTARGGVEYRQAFASGMLLTARADVSYRGRSNDIVNGVGPIDPLLLVDGRIGLQINDRVNVAGVIRNITDRRQVLVRATSLFPGMFNGEVTPPRSALLQLSYTFR